LFGVHIAALNKRAHIASYGARAQLRPAKTSYNIGGKRTCWYAMGFVYAAALCLSSTLINEFLAGYHYSACMRVVARGAAAKYLV